jgi:hypothetical protein
VGNNRKTRRAREARSGMNTVTEMTDFGAWWKKKTKAERTGKSVFTDPKAERWMTTMR